MCHLNMYKLYVEATKTTPKYLRIKKNVFWIKLNDRYKDKR